MKILLINNNPVVNKLVTLSAQKTSDELDVVASLDAITSTRYNLVVVDEALYSDTLLSDLKKKISFEKSLYISPKDVQEMDGFDAILKKPFLPTDLVDTFIQIGKSASDLEDGEDLTFLDEDGASDIEELPDSIEEDNGEDAMLNLEKMDDFELEDLDEDDAPLDDALEIEEDDAPLSESVLDDEEAQEVKDLLDATEDHEGEFNLDDLNFEDENEIEDATQSKEDDLDLELDFSEDSEESFNLDDADFAETEENFSLDDADLGEEITSEEALEDDLKISEDNEAVLDENREIEDSMDMLEEKSDAEEESNQSEEDDLDLGMFEDIEESLDASESEMQSEEDAVLEESEELESQEDVSEVFDENIELDDAEDVTAEIEESLDASESETQSEEDAVLEESEELESQIESAVDALSDEDLESEVDDATLLDITSSDLDSLTSRDLKLAVGEDVDAEPEPMQEESDIADDAQSEDEDLVATEDERHESVDGVEALKTLLSALTDKKVAASMKGMKISINITLGDK